MLMLFWTPKTRPTYKVDNLTKSGVLCYGKSIAVKRTLIEPDHPRISVRRQCELLILNRSSLYYGQKGQIGRELSKQPAKETKENLMFMKLIDRQYTKTPFYGSRRMRDHFRLLDYEINRKRVQRLTRLMELEAIFPKPLTSIPKERKIYTAPWLWD